MQIVYTAALQDLKVRIEINLYYPNKLGTNVTLLPRPNLNYSTHNYGHSKDIFSIKHVIVHAVTCLSPT